MSGLQRPAAAVALAEGEIFEDDVVVAETENMKPQKRVAVAGKNHHVPLEDALWSKYVRTNEDRVMLVVQMKQLCTYMQLFYGQVLDQIFPTASAFDIITVLEAGMHFVSPFINM